MAIRPQMILFGDSITQRSFDNGGWGASLVDQYSRKVDVVLRGYGGYNTRWATFLLNKIFPIPSPNPPLLVTIFFGANDAALLERASAHAHVPLPEYKENLRGIVDHLKKQSSLTKIVLITPPPIDIKGRQAFAKELYGDQADLRPERTNDVAGIYAEGCEAVAKEKGVISLNIWSAFQETPNWEEKYLSDGLHLSPGGNRKLFEELKTVLDNNGLHWETLPYDFPLHEDVDPRNPAGTFETWTKS